ncbi:MAG: polysaccharide lyase family 7 protein [Acidobacteriota bacterium]
MTKRASKGTKSSKLAKKSLKTSGPEPTSGQDEWAPVPVKFDVQWPYNLEQGSRYVELDGTYHLWVLKTDKPYKAGSKTKPRTEQRFKPDYTSGQLKYEADIMVPSGSNGMSIMQIHTINGYSSGGKKCSTAFMLFWFDSDGGSLHQYSTPKPLAKNLTGEWFHLCVIHDLSKRAVTVSVNGKSVGPPIPDKPCSVKSPSYYMKDGVYVQDGASPEMEVYIKNIKMWKHP